MNICSTPYTHTHSLKTMANVKYSDEEQQTFIEMAQTIGISRAMRELGYPNSWATANAWIKARGIEITVDSLKQKAAQMNQWYQDEELLLVAQAGMDRIYEQLQENDLAPDDIKKLSESFQKVANTWLLIKGKSNSIVEKRSVGEMDLEIKRIIAEEEQRNMETAQELLNS